MKKLLTLICLFCAGNTFGQPGGETCASATLIPSIPYVGIGNTVGASDDYFASCPDYGNQGGAGDHVYQFTNGPSDVYVDISLCRNLTNYDSQLYVYKDSCSGTPVGCQEDGCQSPNYFAPYNSSILALQLLANTTYYIVIDGYDAGSQGNYQLNIDSAAGIDPPDTTNLPLVLINTLGQLIVDDPKITADMKIMDPG